MCKNVGREGNASLVVIPALVWKISQQNERGARNSHPPSGARVKCAGGEKGSSIYIGWGNRIRDGRPPRHFCRLLMASIPH